MAVAVFKVMKTYSEKKYTLENVNINRLHATEISIKNNSQVKSISSILVVRRKACYCCGVDGVACSAAYVMR